MPKAFFDIPESVRKGAEELTEAQIVSKRDEIEALVQSDPVAAQKQYVVTGEWYVIKGIALDPSKHFGEAQRYYGVAVDAFKKALELFAKIPEGERDTAWKKEEARIHWNMAEAYFQMGRYKEAFYQYQAHDQYQQGMNDFDRETHARLVFAEYLAFGTKKKSDHSQRSRKEILQTLWNGSIMGVDRAEVTLAIKNMNCLKRGRKAFRRSNYQEAEREYSAIQMGDFLYVYAREEPIRLYEQALRAADPSQAQSADMNLRKRADTFKEKYEEVQRRIREDERQAGAEKDIQGLMSATVKVTRDPISESTQRERSFIHDKIPLYGKAYLILGYYRLQAANRKVAEAAKMTEVQKAEAQYDLAVEDYRQAHEDLSRANTLLSGRDGDEHLRKTAVLFYLGRVKQALGRYSDVVEEPTSDAVSGEQKPEFEWLRPHLSSAELWLNEYIEVRWQNYQSPPTEGMDAPKPKGDAPENANELKKEVDKNLDILDRAERLYGGPLLPKGSLLSQALERALELYRQIAIGTPYYPQARARVRVIEQMKKSVDHRDADRCDQAIASCKLAREIYEKTKDVAQDQALERMVKDTFYALDLGQPIAQVVEEDPKKINTERTGQRVSNILNALGVLMYAASWGYVGMLVGALALGLTPPMLFVAMPVGIVAGLIVYGVLKGGARLAHGTLLKGSLYLGSWAGIGLMVGVLALAVNPFSLMALAAVGAGIGLGLLLYYPVVKPLYARIMGGEGSKEAAGEKGTAEILPGEATHGPQKGVNTLTTGRWGQAVQVPHATGGDTSAPAESNESTGSSPGKGPSGSKS